MPALAQGLRRAIDWHRPMMWFAVAMAVLVPITVIGMIVDDRVLLGSAIWFKPFKFAVSLLLYMVTWAWMMQFIDRGRKLAWRLGTLLALAGAVEMVVIVGQVIRGQRSHFNVATALDATLWTIMGATIVALMVGHIALGVLLLRGRYADAATRSAVLFGLAISSAGMALGFLMTQPTADQMAGMRNGVVNVVGSHSVGVADGGPSMPGTGWNTTGGDLRVPHFVGLHAMQVLPLVAMVLTVLAARWAVLRADAVRLQVVRVLGVGYFGLVGLTTWQALRGQALTRPDVWTLGALAVLVLGVGFALAGVLGSRREVVA